MLRALGFACALTVAAAIAVAPAAAGAERPLNFSVTPASSSLHAAGAHGVHSAALRPPRAFDMLGVSWRGRIAPRVLVRARGVGGRWSAWHALGAADGPDPGAEGASARQESDPAWAGRSDRVQLRLSRRVAGLRLDFVRVPRVGLRARAAQAPGGGVPAIVPRSAWDASACGPPREAPFYGRVAVAFVHHTESLNSYSRVQSPSIVLGICRFHRFTRGWDDIGYNFLVDRFGTIFEGRAGGVDVPVRGAQAGGWNDQSTGISVIGNFVSRRAPKPALDAVASMIRWKLPLEGAPTVGRADVVSRGGPDTRFRAGTSVSMRRISGHRDADATTCPGNALYAQLAQLRAMVGDLAPSLPATGLTAFAPRVTYYPAPTAVTGRLTGADGAALAGAPVDLRAWAGSDWHAVARVTTDGDGAYSATVPLKHNQMLAAFYAGDGAHARAVPSEALAQIRPAMTLAASAPSVAPGAPVQLTGSITPAKGLVGLVISRQSGGVWKRVSTPHVRTNGGGFARTLRIAKPGTYRAYARFGGDRSNAGSRSPSVFFGVG